MPKDTPAPHAAAPARTRSFPLLVSGATALGALGLLGTVESCHFEPLRPVVHYRLAETTTATVPIDENDPTAGTQERIPPLTQAHILGALEMLFGTPSHPGYMPLQEWIDDGYNLNWPAYAADDNGSGELVDADFAPGNARRMKRQLAAIAEGRYEDVVVLDSAPGLARRWSEDLAATPPEARDEEFKAAATDLFLNWYPSLSDSAELYRQQCLHCHGAEGGGDGPTADFLNPRPRDYRLGVFKFTPLRNKAVPRRQDIYRILEQGVTGTAMPSFKRFSRAELEGLVDYVRLLAMRGMVENTLVTNYEFDGYVGPQQAVEAYREVLEKWQRSEDQATELVVTWDEAVPAPSPESIARGRELFMDATTGNCMSCHGESGRGDGLSAWTVDPDTGEVSEAYLDDWQHPISPRNLTQGVLRGGRRPIDIYRRIKAGINGTPMPALEGVVPDEDIWSIVHFVGTLTEGGLFYPELGAHAAPATEGHH